MIAQQMIQENHPAVAITGTLILLGAWSVVAIVGALVRRRVFGAKTQDEALHLEDK